MRAKLTDGARSLAQWLRGTRTSQEALGDALGVSQATVSAWVRGTARPESHFREAMELLARVTREQWETPDERAVVERVRANLKVSGQEEAAPLADVPRTTSKRTGPTRAAPRRAAPPAATGTDGAP